MEEDELEEDLEDLLTTNKVMASARYLSSLSDRTHYLVSVTVLAIISERE